ncbi:MAG TPA: pyridoxal phosphate-dependent aminotransferase [Candidatus Eisenbacteria bacterium]|nr:pyridoxal phosphate-dependent aminotransferase [Candidatus Eisenbacteria bacterium]
MTKLSRRAGRLAESVTLALDARAKALIAKGERVIRFGVGEPDFDTPEHIKAAARRALEGRVGGYTPVAGTPELRQAVAESFRKSGVAAEPQWVIASCGVKHSLFNALAVLLDDGDEAILPSPYWVSYPSMIEASGAKAVVVDTTGDGCVLTPGRLAKALTPRTRVLILVSPGNPTGVTMTRDQMAALGQVLEKHPQVTVVSDEIYEHLVYGVPFVPFAVACPALAPRTVTARGVSKSFAMTGWRIGYATGPKDVIDAMIRFQSHTTSNPTAIAQVATIAALTGPMEPIEAMREAFDRRRKLMSRLLERVEGFRLVPPTGAFYCFPDVSSALRGRTALAFTEELLEKERVVTVPGEAFGAPHNIRLSYACSEADIEEGCARIKRFVEGK